MNEAEKRIRDLEILNGLLKQSDVSGNVLFNEGYPDSRLHGYWYTNPASRGFLGNTLEEAREALDILIDSVKSVHISEKRGNSWLAKLKSILIKD